MPRALKRYLALGDSYTIGEGVSAAERWPAQLARLLGARGVALAEPQIVARTGWTTDELAAGIEEAAPTGPFDLVSLLIGVNNQYRGRGLAEYREQFRMLLRDAISFAGGTPARVIVLSIPDWGVTEFARERDPARIAREINAFNEANRAEAAAAGARYVDVTTDSRTHADDPAAWASDALHPSGATYARWTALVLPVAARALAE